MTDIDKQYQEDIEYLEEKSFKRNARIWKKLEIEINFNKIIRKTWKIE